jgi:hypothetical protein
MCEVYNIYIVTGKSGPAHKKFILRSNRRNTAVFLHMRPIMLC